MASIPFRIMLYVFIGSDPVNGGLQKTKFIACKYINSCSVKPVCQPQKQYICKATLRNVMNFCDFRHFNYGTKPGTMAGNCPIHDANLEGKEITLFKFKTFCLN